MGRLFGGSVHTDIQRLFETLIVQLESQFTFACLYVSSSSLWLSVFIEMHSVVANWLWIVVGSIVPTELSS